MEDLWEMLESVLGPGQGHNYNADSDSTSSNLYLPFVYFSEQYLKLSPPNSLQTQFQFHKNVQDGAYIELKDKFPLHWELPSLADSFQNTNVSNYGNTTISEMSYEDTEFPITSCNFAEAYSQEYNDNADVNANKENGIDFYVQSERAKLVSASVNHDKFIYRVCRLSPDMEEKKEGKLEAKVGEEDKTPKDQDDQDRCGGGVDDNKSKTLYERFYEKLQDLSSGTALDYRIVKVSRSQEADKIMSFFLLFYDNIKMDTITIPLDTIDAIQLKTTKEPGNVSLMVLKLNTPTNFRAYNGIFGNSKKEQEDCVSFLSDVHFLVGTKNNITKIAHQVLDARPLLKSLLENNSSVHDDVTNKQSKGTIYTMYRDRDDVSSGDESDNNELGSDNDWTPYQDVNIVQGENYVEPLTLNSPYNTAGVRGQHRGKPNLISEAYNYNDTEAFDMRVEDIIMEDDEEMQILIQSLLSLNATDNGHGATEGDIVSDPDCDSDNHHAHSHSHSHSHSHGHGHSHGQAHSDEIEEFEDNVSLSDSYLEDILDLDFQNLDMGDFSWEKTDVNQD